MGVLDRTIFKEKHIALVGNAEWMPEQKIGDFIDSFDMVVRFNFQFKDNTESIGKRTDVMVVSQRAWKNFNGKNRHPGIKNALIVGRRPFRGPRTWLRPYLRRYCRRFVGSNEPSTGVMMISFLLNNCDIASLTVFGFDGMKSANSYDERHHAPSHSPEGEQKALAMFSEKYDQLKIYERNYHA